jgi:hypothetical protein
VTSLEGDILYSFTISVHLISGMIRGVTSLEGDILKMSPSRKVTPLIRPDIRCTEMVKEYKMSPSRKVTPLIMPDIRCTDIVKEYKIVHLISGLIRGVTFLEGDILYSFTISVHLISGMIRGVTSLEGNI